MSHQQWASHCVIRERCREQARSRSAAPKKRHDGGERADEIYLVENHSTVSMLYTYSSGWIAEPCTLTRGFDPRTKQILRKCFVARIATLPGLRTTWVRIRAGRWSSHGA